jgi:hypothetical protein
MLKVAQDAARVLGVHLITLDARNADELGAALQKVQRSSAEGFVVSSDLLFLVNKAKIAQAVAKARLPAIFPWKNYHDDGVLMSYGPSMNEIGRHAAVYVDKTLRGAKPAELPVEQMSDYKLIVDLRVASAPSEFILMSLCLAFLRVFVVTFSVLQFSSHPAHAGCNLGIGAVRPLHIFSQAAVGNLPGVHLQAVRQPRIFR